ncbi:NatB ABC-type Na+ efflux pump, permease component [Burkholderiales bacterium]
MIQRFVAVLKKEVVDALRDRRTLTAILIGSVAMGPFILLMLSSLISSMERQVEARTIMVSSLVESPRLVNYLQRQNLIVEEAPADYEALIRRGDLDKPVIELEKQFDALLSQGLQPKATVLSNSDHKSAVAGARRAENLLRGFQRETGILTLASLGLSRELLQPIEVSGLDLAGTSPMGAQLTSMVPYFILMAVVYGALTAALDTTAGERERRSLEPLLMTPASSWALVIGKWGAVTTVAMLITVLSSFSFIPSQWLIASETLSALFQFGPREAFAFVAILIPLGGALAAMLMAVAIRSKTFREAQATSTFVVLGASFIPAISFLNPSADEPWHAWVPALAQFQIMGRVLRGETMPWDALGISILVCALIIAACLGSVTREIRKAV